MSLVDAAQAGGAQHFVSTSFTMKLDFPLHSAKRAAKQHLKGSKLAYTILRPGYFVEVWLSPAMGFDAPMPRPRSMDRVRTGSV